MGYGKRRVKYKLNMSKEAIIKEFVSTQALNFSIKTLLKYWPPNFVTPRSHDRERNVCPIHDSFPRLLQALHSRGVASNVPASCRASAVLTLCPSEADAGDPLSWNSKCATNECQHCPGLKVEVGEGVDTLAEFTFQEWKKAATAKPNEKGEQREIYSLHNTTTTLAEGIQLLQARARVLAKHIYTAYNQ